MLAGFALAVGTLQIPSGTFVDGKPGYNSFQILCRRAGGQDKQSVAQYGIIDGGKMFLVAYDKRLPDDIPPNALLTAYGKNYSVRGSLTCADIDDRIDGWRLTVQ